MSLVDAAVRRWPRLRASQHLLGVGIITLGEQAARKYFNLKLEGFWIVIGCLFLLGGAWELFAVRVGLAPVLCILVGIALLLSPLLSRQRA